ncbi:ImmA/IrrE family metallo-endopeptidase [Castellaniella caeni]|uniref:ImmA/IrrE family metallo-endopeptidase n=1 Tax=Castellaniella caeni TaxID=266123 RepID=UPI000C9F3F4C|nr:hypothetical protein [Castellaniella caeni]
MAEMSIDVQWMAAASGEPEIQATAAWLGISVDGVSLTRNQDIWAKTVRDNVFVSAYPLAMWLANSWWRLNHEPLPRQQPGHGWRMAHELGAANHGFVWPRIMFIPDGEFIDVWARASMTPNQSVQYLQTLDAPKQLGLAGFHKSVEQFMGSVLARLDAREASGSDLAHVWAILQEELADPEMARRRKLEAQLGFDAEACPEEALSAALQWSPLVGDEALSELAPAIASFEASPDLALIGRLADADGMVGAPEFSFGDIDHLRHGAPWERAVHDARALRQKLGNTSDPIPSQELQGLLGLGRDAVAAWPAPQGRSPVAVAMPTNGRHLKFIPRRHNPVGKRFELARFLGEHLRTAPRGARWLASTDLGTYCQKYQRAFAAEFLCPINALLSYLDGDFSSYAMEEAAERFDVSEQTVTSLLYNNGHLHRQWSEDMPYQVAVA